MRFPQDTHRGVSSFSLLTTTTTAARTRASTWRSRPGPRTCLFLALCCYCLFSTSLEWNNGVSAATIAVVTRNGVYHHIERRQVPDGASAGDTGGSGVRLPHSPYTPINENGDGELQTGPSKKKRSDILVEESTLPRPRHTKPDDRLPQAAVGKDANYGDASDRRQGVILGDDGAAVRSRGQTSGTRLKDQGNAATEVEFVELGSTTRGEPLPKQAEDNSHHQHEVKEGVAAAADRFEHMDIWSEDDEEEAPGFIQPAHFPVRDLFGERAATDIDSRVAPEHIAHSEHDYLDDSDEDDQHDNNDNDNEQGESNPTVIEWSVDEWEEEFEGDLADWTDWMDDHDEPQRREPEASLTVKVKVMGHAALEHVDEDQAKKEESPFQRLFSELWF